ncbi:MAG: tetratricopeptide repeat protein [Deltaproteobacteria bacterium]|nr:tetratricopeptide repeat protein [Deltaproteobacteria bacterium]
MSLIDWLTGGTFETNQQNGNELFDDKQYGEAKLAYQRALKKTKNVENNEIEKAKKRIVECSFFLASMRLETAKKIFDSGDTERALEAIEDIDDISDDPRIIEKTQELVQYFEKMQSESEASQAEHMSDEDIIAVISGTWTMNQAEEFSDMPETFLQGLVAAHDGDTEKAVALVKKAIDEYENAVLAHLELAKLYILNKKYNEALATIELFTSKAVDDFTDELLTAFTMQAQINIELKNFEQAEKALLNAYKADPENHVPMLNLGMFLRDQKEYKRAKTALKNALDNMGKQHPDMRVPKELGLTILAMGDKKEAKDYLKSCIEYWNSQGEYNQYDPETALALAKIHEEDGELEESSGIYRHLCQGYDRDNFFTYNYEAARLLLKLNKKDVAKKYLVDAEKLASDKNDVELLQQLHQ